MNVEKLMTREVETCTPESDLAQAAMIMWRRDCGFVPVIDPPSGRLVGVITDRDICMAAATQHHSPDTIPVGAIMTRQVYSCTPRDTVRTALHKMAEAQVRRIPVVDAERSLQGVLALNDVVLAAERNGRRTEDMVAYADVVATLKTICAHRLPAPQGLAL